MEQNTTETLSKVSTTLTQAPVKIEIDIPAKNWLHQLLQRHRILPAKRTFYIKPVTLGNLSRISKLLLEINVEGFDPGKFLESNYELLDKHGKAIAEVVAIAITNTKAYPSKELIDFIRFNLNAKDLLKVLGIVLKALDVSSFTLSITLIKGLNVLEKSEKKKD